jgi:hypothetical protein
VNRPAVCHVDQPGDLRAVDRLVLEQSTGDGFEARAVLLQQDLCPQLLRPEDPLDLLVDDAARVL